ncbi:mucin-5AC isoform X1 [Musca domestica]|uniref:Mucin-5AC isoform X1 n=2 Tax=Musca domestica TaxID=7370 RepID=A0A1I8MB62_MUSDO|nr:mucin-5AC isoform X1 [Musca domestica]
MGTQQEPCNTANTSAVSALNKPLRTTQRGGTSESSTTSDNTSDFIEIVKKHDVVYNTHHPDYKNVEVKLKIWNEIANEIGLSVDASKRKWKNLRDSYTKYLRSFRVGSKTSKKYQFWAHADHMEFLKPYQGPGRSNNGIIITKDEEETECDLGFQVLTKATSNSTDDDVKPTSLANTTAANIFATSLASVLPNFVGGGGGLITSSALGLTTTSSATTNGFSGGSGGPLVLPVPSLPTVQLPPSLTAKPMMTGGIGNPSSSTSSSTTTPSLGVSIALSTPSSSSSASISTSNGTTSTPLISASMAAAAATVLTTPSSMASQIFALPQLSAKGTIPMPSSNTASSVGCLIIEPQLFASADTFKKELTNVSTASSSSSSTCTTQITPSNLHIYPNISAQVSQSSSSAATANTTNSNRLNPPLITKIRRVQPSPHQTPAPINLSFSSSPAAPVTSTSPALSSLGLNAAALNGFLPTVPPNLLSTFATNFAQANLGSTATITTPSNSFPGSGGGGPSPAKRLKTAELEISAILQANRDLDANTLFFLSLARSVRSMPTKFQSLAKMRCMRIVSDIELELDNVNCENGDGSATKYCTNNTDSPPTAFGSNINEPSQLEHFVYVMSPSRVEGMIELSSDDENGGGGGVGAGAAAGSGGGGATGNGVIGSSN